jgi:hypothetical protein
MCPRKGSHVQEITAAMSELNERMWKPRFVARLAELFAQSPTGFEVEEHVIEKFLAQRGAAEL